TIKGATTSISLSSGQTLTAKAHIKDLAAGAASLLTAQPTTASLAGHATIPVDSSYGVDPLNPATFDLSLASANQLATKLTATAAAPPNGRLTAAANLTLTVGGATPVTVTVPADSTNQAIDDVVAD